MNRAAIMSLLVMILALHAPPPAAAIDSFFDIFTELSVVGPPYPTAPIITIVGENLVGGFQPQQECSNQVGAIHLNGLPPGVPILLTPRGGGVGGAPPSIDSFFDVFVDLEFPAPTAGQLRKRSDIRILHPPGNPPGNRLLLLPINPLAPPGSVDSFFDIFVDDSFFDIHYRVADPGGYHDYRMHGVSPSGRMSFFDIFIELGDLTPDAAGRVDSFFDIFVDFSIVDNSPCPTFPCPTDYCDVTVGSRVPNPVAVQPTTWTAIKVLLN